MKTSILYTIGLATLLALSGLVSAYVIVYESVDGRDVGSKRRLDFDEDTYMHRDKLDAIPTGDANYMLWNDWGGTWSDAEKLPYNYEDDLMCWAAAASNVLEWTGWGLVAGMSNTDEIFQHFQDHWTDEGSLPDIAWHWWFDGTEIVPGPGWSHVDVPGGGNFWPTYTFTDYYDEQWMNSQTLAAIDTFLHDGYGVTLAIYTDTGDGHAITCWGFSYDFSDPDYYVGLWVTDSDDDKHLSSPPDSLRYYEVVYDSGNSRWHLQNFYGSDNWYIGGVMALARAPADWPMHGNDRACTSYSFSSAPNTNATTWVSDLPEGTVWSYPIVAEGKVFIGTGGYFTAWSENNGSLIWSFRAPEQPGYPVSSATADGKVFFGTAEPEPGPGGCIYALNTTTGEEIWNFTTEEYLRWPVVVEDRLYFGVDTDAPNTGKIYCINSTTGEHIWNFTTQDKGVIVAVAYGKVYAVSGHWTTSANAAIYCLDMYDGSYVWSYDNTERDLAGGLAVANGKVYATVGNEYANCIVLALNATNGDKVWNTTRYTSGYAGRIAVAYGKVFIGLGGGDSGVYALDEADGDEIWAFPSQADAGGGPVVADDKVFFAVTYPIRMFYAVNATTGAVVWSYKLIGSVHSWSSAVANGRVFVADHYDQKLYAFGGTPYVVTIKAYCYTEDSDISVSITMDGSPTGYNTPHTFTELTGIHTFTVPSTDPSGHPFYQWSTGETSLTITVSSGQIYTAYYAPMHLRFKVIGEPALQLIAMLTGDVDVLTQITNPADIETLSTNGFTITSALGSHISFIGFNIRPDQSYRRGSVTFWPLADVNFRHALIHVFDQIRIVDTIYGYTVRPIQSLVPPAQSNWLNPGVPTHPYNPGDPFATTVYDPATGENEDTCSILRYGGYTFVDADSTGTVTNPDYWNMPNGNPLPQMEVLCPTMMVDPQKNAVVSFWLGDCSNIGLQASPQNGQSGLTMSGAGAGSPFWPYTESVYMDADFDVFIADFKLNRFPDHLYDWLHSSQDNLPYPGRYNAFGINDPVLDDLVETVKFSLDHDEKNNAAWDVQERLSSSGHSWGLPVIPVYSMTYFDAFNPDLRGIVPSPGFGTGDGGCVALREPDGPNPSVWTYLNIHWDPGTERLTPEGEPIIIWVLSDFPEIFNPLYAGTTMAWEILDRIYDPLMLVNPYTLEDLPWLAEDWETTLTETGMDVTYYLRNDTFWQDGNPYTAYDAEFSLEFLRDNQIPKYAPSWQNIIDVEVIDPFTFTVHANETSQFLIYDWASLAALLPPQVWTAWNGQPLNVILGRDLSTEPGWNGMTPTNLFGTGPFVFQYYDPVAMVADLTNNFNYFRTAQSIQDQKVEMFHEIGDVGQCPVPGPWNQPDGVINVWDLTYLMYNYGCFWFEPPADPDDRTQQGYRDYLDINSDRIIDLGDISAAAYYQGKQREYPIP